MKKKHPLFSGNLGTKLYVCRFLLVCLGALTHYPILRPAFLRIFCKLRQDVKVTTLIGKSCSTVSNRADVSKQLLKVLDLLMHSSRRENHAVSALPI